LFHACRTKNGVNKRIVDNVLPALLNKSRITHFGNTFFKNPDRFSLAQSSYNPEDFGSRKGAGHAIYSARGSLGKAFASSISEMKTYRDKFNQGSVIDASELSRALEAALDAEDDAETDVVYTLPVGLPEETSGHRRYPARVKARAGNDGLVADTEDDCIPSPGLLLCS
jgi:hypothetical protein